VVDDIAGLATSSDAPTLRITVRNAGSGAAAASQLALHTQRSSDNQFTDKVLDVPALAPGASTTVQTACEPYASDMATATADGPNALAESDEGNNVRSVTGSYCRYP
jgi:subtilase family serine protease